VRRTRSGAVLGVTLSVLVVMICLSGAFRIAFSFPEAVTVFTGQDFTIDTGFPVVSVYSNGAARVESHPWAKLPNRLTMDTGQAGEYAVEFKLFGFLPLRRVSLVVTDRMMVVPGGHSIGVILRSTGLVVTGLSPVVTVDGRETWPAKSAGIESGDTIISAGDKPLSTKEELAILVEAAGRAGEWVDLLIEKPDGSTIRRNLAPVKHRNGGYQIGILVKDTLAGVGTLTFYEPETGLYTALGHVISETDSQKPAAMKQGQIVRATVTGVQPSRKGAPGEVMGTFVEGEDVIGSILQNGPCGITGVLGVPLGNPYYSEPIPLGFESQVKRGPATFLTTIDGTTIEEFSIEIEQLFSGGTASKGFVVRVTDERLLQRTGGIVQGMSGSPIIQDGVLVGAVTHVLVNDPSRGYGTYAERMAREARMIPGLAEADAGAGSVVAFKAEYEEHDH
jgi:stage IV sporulation protein B